ncbi:MAG: FAD-dependent oxidoreductase, partial [Thiothrix sp.]|nr:FAD-dependent oxidoreductase [Thiothrix sp.]
MSALPPVTLFGPDFPFAYDDWLHHPAGLGQIPASRHGQRVAIIGAGIAGLVCGYELMKLGLQPVFYESGQLGGRLRSQVFEGTEDVVAELGGMRFPESSRAFYHYADLLGAQSRPFPNPLTPAAGSTVIDLEGETFYAETLQDLPAVFQEVEQAYQQALEEGAGFSALQQAIRLRDRDTLKALWNPLVQAWDEGTFYDFITSSTAFRQLSFRHREIFGQVGFGTGGWDSDFPNSMLEILRVNVTGCDENQRFFVGGVEQIPRRLWRHAPARLAHWPQGTHLAGLNQGAPRPGASAIFRDQDGLLNVTDQWGRTDRFSAVVATCQSWLL